jgi:Alpha/beta hydrolase domain
VVLTRLRLEESLFAGGRAFGAAGPCVQLRGKAFFAVHPRLAANHAIVDLELASTDRAGRVGFEADLRILMPRDPAARNKRLVLDVVNRGNPVVIRNTDLGPNRLPDAESEGWLLQQGFTVVSCGWQHNVPQGTERFALLAPEALEHGRRLTGPVRSVLQLNAPSQVVGVADEPSGAQHVVYPVADPDDPGATLTQRDYPLGPGRLIPRNRWSFGHLVGGVLVADRTHVFFAEGFAPGEMYELIYTAEGAPITGIGFAALRDVVSFLRFAPSEAGNPCAASIDHAVAFGGSQTGRLLRHMLHQGFCVDEEGRLVLDGVLTLIAGPLLTEANWRFGQPSFIGSDSPGFAFPFTDAAQTDPVTNQTDGLLHKLSMRGTLPKVMHLNTSAEYANLDAALIHLAADGQSDVAIPENVRIYQLTGAHHGGGSLPLDNRVFNSAASYYNNSVDYRPLVRAAFRNLDRWVTMGAEPPPSTYPRLSDGTLLERISVLHRLEHLPGPGMPTERLYPTRRLDYGAGSSRGRAVFPPHDTGAYAEYLPAVDADGNEVCGVRHPDVAVPLGTYTGWNPRHQSIGGTQMNLLLNGSTIPFARTRAEREATGDARLSIEERYPSREAFLDLVRASAVALARTGYLLDSDVESIVAASARRYAEFMQLESPLPGASGHVGAAIVG